MAEKVSRQTGHCMAGEAGLLLCGATGGALVEAEGAEGDSVRSMVISSSGLLDAFW